MAPFLTLGIWPPSEGVSGEMPVLFSPFNLFLNKFLPAPTLLSQTLQKF